MIIGWILVVMSFVILILAFVFSDLLFKYDYGIPIFIIIYGTLAITGLLMVYNQSYKNGMNQCQSIGGKYIVVDKQFNGKVWVDIYGCIKEK